MDVQGDYSIELERALSLRRDFLERKELPRLKEQFQIFQTGVKTIASVLLRKSLIKEDPYRREQKITEIRIPPTGPVTESDRMEQLSLRLSELEGQVDFVCDIYQFSLSFLTLGRLKLLADLVRYVSWDKLTEISASVTTRLLAELATKVKQGGDTLSARIFQDAHNQLAKASGDILRILRDLSSFRRESYKLAVRRSLFAGLTLTAESIERRRQEVVRSLKSRFTSEVAADAALAAELGGGEGAPPFYPELFEEVIDEDYSSERESLRRDVLERLRVADTPSPQKRAEQSLKPLLMETIHILSSASGTLAGAAEKLTQNYQAHLTRRLRGGERFRRWLRRLVFGSSAAEPIEVEMVDPATSIRKIEEIDMRRFLDRLERRSRVLGNLISERGPAVGRLQASSEDQILKFIALNLDDLHEIAARLPALDEFFKKTLSPEGRPGPAARGLKLEISALKTAMVKANQKRHEYLSRTEEEAQLRRLGISADGA